MSFHDAALEQDDKRYLWHPFTQQQDWEAEPQVLITEAQGCYLIDDQGRRYLDGVSSLWANLHGHRHPRLTAAIKQQLDRMAHSTMLGLMHPTAIQLGKRLVALAPGRLSRVFYSDTGAAAMEIALKIACQYWQQADPPQPRKTAFLSISHAYHGDTVGAMSVGGIALYRETYSSLCFPTIAVDATTACTCGKGCTSCGVPCLHELARIIAQHAHELAAVIIEPLFQGAGGIRVYPQGYSRAVWELAKQHQLLFIVDEVATGFGRTGKFFACEQEGIEPDMMGLAKGISGGYLPLAATLVTEEIYQAFCGPGRTFYHGHTYTGNALACAAALANLDIFEQEQTLQKLQPRIQQLHQGLERLRTLPMVADIRTCGFVAGIELAAQKHPHIPFAPEQQIGVRVIKEARKRGVILRPLSDVIVLMPPLAIAEHELAQLLQVTEEALLAVAQEVAHA